MASTNVGNAYVTVSARFDKSWSSGVLTKANAVGDLISKGVSAAFGAITSSLDQAISRVDTMGTFPRIMENMGIGAEAATKAMDTLSSRIDGLPTALDSAVLGVERFTAKNGDIGKSTDYFLALNDALLAGGASSELQASALEQLLQSYSKGKMDMMEWRSLQQAMPAQLNQVAKAMGKTTDELGEGLRKGEISMDEFMDAIVRLDSEGVDGFASFAEQSKTSTATIGTALTNVQNRVNKAVASILDSIGQENISGAINAFSSNFKNLAQPIIDFIESFKANFNFDAFLTAFKPFEGIFENIGQTVRSLASNLGELFANIMTVGAPAFQLIGGIISGSFMAALNVVNAVAGGLNALFDEFDMMQMGWDRQTSAIAATGKELDTYVQTIEELAGQDELTAIEQEKLKQAVEGYNKITGDSVEITNAAKGELSKSTEEIQKNAQAWLDNAYAQAYQQQVADIIADTIQKQQELAEATRELTETEQRYQDVLSNPEKYSLEMYNEAANAVNNARAKVVDLTQGIEDNNRKLEEAQGRVDAADKSLLGYIDSNTQLQQVMSKAGTNSTKFSNLLASIGKNEKDLEKMSPSVVNGLANISKASGTMGETAAKAFLGMTNVGESTAKNIMTAFSPLGSKITSEAKKGESGMIASNKSMEQSSRTASTNSQNAWNPFPGKLGTLFNTAKSNATTALNAVSSSANSSSSASGRAFSSIPGVIGSYAEDARRRASSSISGIASSSGSSASNSVPPWSGLGNRIKNAIGNVSFPQPHVSFTWESVGGIKVPFPRVSWYAKGAMFDGASIIGVGEAGPEMVLPQSGGLMDTFSENVTEHVSNEDLINWLEGNLGPIIEGYAPTSTPRETRRMIRKVAAYA